MNVADDPIQTIIGTTVKSAAAFNAVGLSPVLVVAVMEIRAHEKMMLQLSKVISAFTPEEVARARETLEAVEAIELKQPSKPSSEIADVSKETALKELRQKIKNFVLRTLKNAKGSNSREHGYLAKTLYVHLNMVYRGYPKAIYRRAVEEALLDLQDNGVIVIRGQSEKARVFSVDDLDGRESVKKERKLKPVAKKFDKSQVPLWMTKLIDQLLDGKRQSLSTIVNHLEKAKPKTSNLTKARISELTLVYLRHDGRYDMRYLQWGTKYYIPAGTKLAQTPFKPKKRVRVRAKAQPKVDQADAQVASGEAGSAKPSDGAVVV